jgi:ribose transport system ATP-binding protein
VVHQELSLVPDLTVAENIYLPNQPAGKFGLVSKKRVQENAQKHLESLGIKDIDAAKTVQSLSLRDRQLVEIAKALLREVKILVLDEPTSALGLKDVEWLFGLIQNLSSQGVTVIYISHRMGEIRGLCKRLTILRNGRNVGTYVTKDIDDDEVVRLMIGSSLNVVFPPKPDPKSDSMTTLELKNINNRSGLHGVNLSLKRGEVVGIAALQGHGQEALFECLFGLDSHSDGDMLVNGKPVRFHSPRAAIHHGGQFAIGLIPEDRKRDGLIVDMSVRDNVTLPILENLTRFGWIQHKKEMAEITKVLKKMNINFSKINDMAVALSGGNQQKLVMAKWLLTDCQIMLMYDPTRGVDIGTKVDIYKLIRGMADEGKSVLFYSSEISEVLGLSDRILVLYKGRISREFAGKDIDDIMILSAMLGIGKEAKGERVQGEGNTI